MRRSLKLSDVESRPILLCRALTGRIARGRIRKLRIDCNGTIEPPAAVLARLARLAALARTRGGDLVLYDVEPSFAVLLDLLGLSDSFSIERLPQPQRTSSVHRLPARSIETRATSASLTEQKLWA